MPQHRRSAQTAEGVPKQKEYPNNRSTQTGASESAVCLAAAQMVSNTAGNPVVLSESVESCIVLCVHKLLILQYGPAVQTAALSKAHYSVINHDGERGDWVLRPEVVACRTGPCKGVGG